MPSPKAEFSDAFTRFFNDPGIRIEHLGGSAALPEIFVYPDLVPFGRGAAAVSSTSILDPARRSGALLVTGPEDSGKTALLKSLAAKLLDAGWFPVYLDGREAPASNPGGVPEAARAAAEAQYMAESSAVVNGPGAKKRVLLFDNFDLGPPGELGPEALAQALHEDFALVILTASHPYPAFENSFSIAEMRRALRDELIRKWVLLRTSDADEIASLAEKARGMVDAVLGKNIVPSYPVFVLTILESSVPAGSAGQAGSSYGYYYEYAVTKPLRESGTAAEFDLYSAVLSELAYSRLAGGRRTADKPELSTLILRHAPGADADAVIHTFIKSKTLREAGGAYEFASGYAYHYFSALYLSRKIDSGEVRDRIAYLFSRLGDGDNAGVALFLAYLSPDPFVTEQIGKGVGHASGEETRRTDEERESYIEELLAGLEREKPDELHEIRAEYRIRGTLGRTYPPSGPRPDSVYDRTRLRETGALLRILAEGLSLGRTGDASESAYSLWTAHLSERLAEIDALRSGARVKDIGREEKLRLLLLYESAYAESLRLLSILTASGASMPEGTYALAASLLKANPDTSRAVRFAEENPERKFARRLIVIAAAESLRLFPHSPETEKELKGIAEGRFGKKSY